LVVVVVATLVGDDDHWIGTVEIVVPVESLTTPDSCATSPILMVEALAVIEIVLGDALGLGWVAVVSTVIVMLRVVPSAVADTVAVPDVVPAVINPVEEIVATAVGEIDQLTVTPVTGLP
jgi:hypothetical protein